MAKVKSKIFFTEKNHRGAWVVYGFGGIKQYYGYTKAEAEEKYTEEYGTLVEERERKQ